MTILKAENIYKNFEEIKVLNGISFEQEEGEVISIIGSSGSGKTTLLRCITGLEQPTQGKITVANRTTFNSNESFKKSIEEKRLDQLSTGLVFQQFNLFPQYTVLENVMLAAKLALKKQLKKHKTINKKIAEEEITVSAKKLINTVGLSEKINSYPCELSGGQKQRVAIARALMLSPKVLCFDEPTSALDPEITGEVLKVIKKLADEGRTMLIVTHEMGFAKAVSNKIIFMSDGIIEEKGSPNEIFENPKSERLKNFLKSTIRI